MRQNQNVLMGVGLVLIALVVSACSLFQPLEVPSVGDPASESGGSMQALAADETQYLILFKEEALPGNLRGIINSAGGRLVTSLDAIGVAIAHSSDADFATNMADQRGVQGVEEDPAIRWIPETLAYGETFGDDDADPSPGNGRGQGHGRGGSQTSTESSGETLDLTDLQWNLDIIQAHAAHAHNTGAGITVAVLDTGIDADHPALEHAVDTNRSVSLVAGEDLTDFNGHGTHVAGIIAARGAVLGVAPDSTIMAVKVLGAAGSGDIGTMIRGILYAVQNSADVVNLSMGALFWRSVNAADNSVRMGVMNRAVNYAHRHGTVVVAATGNEGLNLAQQYDQIMIPAQSGTSIAVGATDVNDNLAAYSNYGAGGRHLTAPGGGGEDGEDINDWVISTWSRSSQLVEATYISMAGTSQATPHVAGVAALVMAQHGLQGSDVIKLLQQTTDDVGSKTEYGHGRVNAYRAVTGN